MSRQRMSVAIALLTTLVSMTSCQAVAQDRTEEERVDRKGDIQRMLEWVDLDRSFTNESRARAQERARALLVSADSLKPVELFLELAAIAALADNGHSNLSMGPVYRFGLVGIGTYWFDDGLYVVRAIQRHRGLLGARVVSIGGRPLAEIVERLEVYHGGTIEHFKEYFSTPLLLSPRILHAAGLIDDPDQAAFGFEFADGRFETITLEVFSGEIPRSRPWERLLPLALGAESGGWVSYLAPGTEMLLALQQPDEVFRYVHLEDVDAVYLQLRANFDVGGHSIRRFLRDASTRLRTDRPRYIILDNRQNGGGDLTRTADFAMDLPSLVPEDGKVYVLTGHATFSAGIYTSFFPKAADPAKTVVVGERVGDRERFWAETGDPFVLPGSGYRVAYSLQLHDLAVGCSDKYICHMTRHKERWNIAVGSLNPDVEIHTTFGDYARQHDPQLEYTLRQIRGHDEARP